MSEDKTRSTGRADSRLGLAPGGARVPGIGAMARRTLPRATRPSRAALRRAKG